MTDPTPPPALAVATPRSSLWPGLVWAIPLAALLIVVFLGVRALANQGVNVVVSFSTASGIKVGDTKVIYQGYEVGRVVKIEVDKNVRDMDITLRLENRAKIALNTNTVFWLIGAKPSLNNLSSVKAAFAGLAIGMAPDFSGQPKRRFKGLDDEPIVLPGTPGTSYSLSSDHLGSVKRGSTLDYQGQAIGKVTQTTLVRPGEFQVRIFVDRPFEALIRPDTLFWTSSPLQVSLKGGVVQAQLADASTLLGGGIDIDIPEAPDTRPSPPGSRFALYENRAAAEADPPGPQVRYGFTFPGAGGDLAKGAPVTLLGFPVGTVKTVRLAVDARTGAPSTVVVAALDASRLHVVGPAGATDPAAWRGPTDAAVGHLLSLGYRARLAQKPPLIGGRLISLDRIRGAAPANLSSGELPQIPAAQTTGDIDDLTAQADQILSKVSRIPIEAIGRDVRQITGRLNTLVSSPQVADSLQHLQSTLAQVDEMVTQVKPQVGPLVAKLNQAAGEVSDTASAAKGVLTGDGAPQDASLPDAIRELTDASRSIRTLADYLGRHPEALIKGKSK